MKKYTAAILCLFFTFCCAAVSAAEKTAFTAVGYAATRPGGPLIPYRFTLPELGGHDMLVEIAYAGVCHSDIHLVNGEHGPIVEYPYVPGHEIVGRVSAVGKNVTKFKINDTVGIGSMLGSCGECEYCRAGQEQYCIRGADWTGGGYATHITVNEKFAAAIPREMPAIIAAPLMCAGITTYSPLKRLKVKKGDSVAVAGLGGLGHLALQYAVSMGAEVTVFEITDAKAAAAKRLGAADYVNTRDNPALLERYRNKFKAVISTIPVKHDIQPYIDALKETGTLVILGMPPLGENIMAFDSHVLTSGGKCIMGSSIGGMRETEEMLRYSATHGICPEVEVISANQINSAFKRVKAGDVQFRFVIAVSSMRQ